MRKIKILFVHHGRGIGGAPTSMMQLINALNKDIFEIKILFIYNTPILLELCEEYKIDYKVLNAWFFRNVYVYWSHSDAKTSSGKISIKRILLILYNISRKLISYPIISLFIGKYIIRRENPDIIHLNTLFLTDWLIASKMAGKKTIVHIREPLSFGKYGIRKSYFQYVLNKCANHIFAISKDNFERINIPNKTSLLYNSFDFNNIFPNIKQKDKNINFYLVYLGGGLPRKGFELILEICDKLPVDIMIFMAGHYTSVQENYIKKKNNLKYIGPVKDPYELISKSDVLLFPATVPHFPKPVTEAFLYKKTAIVSDNKGNDEILKSYENGILFKTGDSNAFKNAILYLYNNRDKCRIFGQKGYEFVKENFDIKKNIKIVEKIYTDIKQELNFK